jgi:hypothetical protein
VLAATAAAHDRGRDGGKIGPYPVGHTSFIVTNDSGRPVAVEVWYPADDDAVNRSSPEAVYAMDPYYGRLPESTSADWEAMGYDRSYQEPAVSRERKFPLVMFSSGFTMPAWAYLYAGTRLASHGFMVAAVQHFSEAAWPWDGYDGAAFIAYNRPRDISFALSELLRRNRTRGDVLYRTIDDRHIVSSGHSYGGYAAMVEVGGDDQVCDARDIIDTGEELPPEACQPSPPDPRFSALMTLDGSAQVLRFGEMARIEVPSLNMGEESYERWGGPWLTFVARPHAAIFRHTPAVRVDVVDSDHFSFSNECDGVRWLFRQGAISQEDMDNYYEPIFCQAVLPFAEGHRIVTKYMVAFLKSVVLHDEDQARILTPADVIAHEPNVELYWSERCHPAESVHVSQFTYRTDMFHGCAVGDKDPADFFYPPNGNLIPEGAPSVKMVAPISRMLPGMAGHSRR